MELFNELPRRKRVPRSGRVSDFSQKNLSFDRKSLCARFDKIGPGRVLDDNATIMLEYDNGAKGVYWSSQAAMGYDNGLQFRVFGTKGGLEWRVEDPNYLKVSLPGKPRTVLSRGRDGFYPRAQSLSRIPSGHPEGYFEAMANI